MSVSGSRGRFNLFNFTHRHHLGDWLLFAPFRFILYHLHARKEAPENTFCELVIECYYRRVGFPEERSSFDTLMTGKESTEDSSLGGRHKTKEPQQGVPGAQVDLDR